MLVGQRYHSNIIVSGRDPPSYSYILYTYTYLDWKATALKTEVFETVAEGGRKFMVAWRKDEVDAARHRQEKRGNETGKVCYRTLKCRILRSDNHWPSRRVEGTLVRTRDGTETCVTPRHM